MGLEYAREELAARLWRIGAVRLGEFILSSGKKSDIYIDLRMVPSHPDVFRLALSLMHATAARILPEVDGLIGVATGGIQWSTGMSLLTGLPAGYVRVEKKEHGLARSVEGDIRGRVLLIDDVATTGCSLARAVDAIRGEKLVVQYALVVVDRKEGAAEALQEKGVQLLSVLTIEDIRRARSST